MRLYEGEDNPVDADNSLGVAHLRDDSRQWLQIEN